jgi:hypothetical protein
MKSYNKKIGALFYLVLVISLFSIFSVSAFDWTGLIAYHNCSSVQVSASSNPSLDFIGGLGSPTFNATTSPFSNNMSCSVNGIGGNNVLEIPLQDNTLSTDLNESATINFWIYVNNFPVSSSIFFGTESSYRIYVSPSALFNLIVAYDSSIDNPTVINKGQWYMVTILKNSSDTCLGVDNNFTCSGIPSDFILPSFPFYIGGDRYLDNSYGIDALVDEISFFNRTLLDSELSDLFNNHVTYGLLSAPSISFVSPTDENGDSYARKYVLVNVSSSDLLDNISIYLYDVNNTLINSSTTFSSPNYRNFSVNSDGTYHFSATSCYQSLCSSTAISIVYIDTFFPSVDIITPDDLTYWSSKPTFINITAVNTGNISKCWFSMDNGVTNITFPSCHEGTNNKCS